LSYRFARLYRLAELILGLLKSLKIRALKRRKKSSPEVRGGGSQHFQRARTDLVVSGKRCALGLVVEEEGRVPGTCVVEFLTTTMHPQQYREFQARQARNRRY
jgi:hypothetical protein